MEQMLAMVLEHPGTPLRTCYLPRPTPSPGEVLLRVEAFPLAAADDALQRPRRGAIRGAAVLLPPAG
jgi:NADPH:quinone reductase-like Zn-dependent oxidoreductase